MYVFSVKRVKASNSFYYINLVLTLIKVKFMGENPTLCMNLSIELRNIFSFKFKNK